MTDAHDDHRPETPGHDRRAFLQRAGLGAVAAGAWVAPQVLFTSVASAGCTPITKWLQIDAGSCGQVAPTNVDSNDPGCVPPSWSPGQSSGVTFTCVATSPDGSDAGASITITSAGCTPAAGQAVLFCSKKSGNKYDCVAGTVAGSTITFPTLSQSQKAQNCVYLDFRITVTCCT